MSMENRKGILFDLDGTLVDTLGDLADATNQALRNLGYPPCPEEDYRQMVGSGARVLMERALSGNCHRAQADAFTGQGTVERTADSVEIETLLAEFLRLYDAGCLRRTRPYAGIPELLCELERRGTRLAVVTNKPQAQAEKITAYFFGSRFDFVIGGSPARAKKPDPGAVREILAAWDMPPADALFVGDSDVDIFTAKNAGLRSAGAVWGFRGEEELRRAGADFLLQKPENLLNCY